MTIHFIREFGEFIEYIEGIGYVYKQGNKYYSIGSYGIKELN